MQGESKLTSVAQPDRLSLFSRFAEYEQRSLQHDVGESARQQQISNWDGVVFRLGDHYLTCRIDQVEEIIAFPGITPIPGAKEWLLGLASVRGNLAPVSDLGWFLFGSRTPVTARTRLDRKSTRLNSSHVAISYAVFCLKKKTISLSLRSTKPGRSMRTNLMAAYKVGFIRGFKIIAT